MGYHEPSPTKRFRLPLAVAPHSSFALHRHPQLDPVIRCVHQILLRTEVTLGRLHRSVPEEQLNLLQFTARRATQLRAGATVMPHAASSSLCRIPDYAACVNSGPPAAWTEQTDSA